MKKKGRKFKRIICCILCCILLVGTTANVYASSYSVSYAKILPFKKVSLTGHKTYKGYKASTRMIGYLYNMNKMDPDTLDIYQTVKFIGTTGGTYLGPTTKVKVPSKIVQTDTVKATGVKVGVSLNSKSASISLSGTSKTKTYKYTVSNQRSISNDVSYVVQGLVLTSVTVTTSTTYTWNAYGKTLHVVPGDSQ